MPDVQYPKFVEHYGRGVIVDSAEDEAALNAMPPPASYTAAQANIQALIEGQREASANHALLAEQWKAEDDAVAAARADILDRQEQGRVAANDRMTELGGTWPDDMKAEETAPPKKRGKKADPTPDPAPADVVQVPTTPKGSDPVPAAPTESKLGDPAAVSNNPTIAANPVADKDKVGDVVDNGKPV